MNDSLPALHICPVTQCNVCKVVVHHFLRPPDLLFKTSRRAALANLASGKLYPWRTSSRRRHSCSPNFSGFQSYLLASKSKIDVQYFSIICMSDNYQLAIVGSGSGGCGATCLAARNDLRAALIERDRIGGACFHSGSYAVVTLQASRVPQFMQHGSNCLGLFGVLEMSKLESPEWFRCRQPGCNLRALSTRTHNEQSKLAAGEPNRPGRNQRSPQCFTDGCHPGDWRREIFG